ncbi:MAG: acetylxylan esterase [Verrucomicrobia bacterium]|nr:acetylxylan esterase [Verrucomicrobiota bacterium]
MKPLLALAFFVTVSCHAAESPALPTADVRGEIRDLNTPRSMPHFHSRAEWLAHAAWLREHILVSCGLWPAPQKCPLNAQVFGRIERDGYSVEKVFFESWPGFYVSGNLYRPLGRGKGPFPAILNPHGHWKVGRLADEDKGSLPGRCIGFARQGYVAFSWDMIGYNDSFHWQHDFPPAGGREWLWGLSLFGLQTWNSIRVVDFLQSLPDVDPARIGCTGESGGGTQTFILTAVEDRIKAAAPAVMVSAIMQGGCLCENGPNLRQDTFNVEISAAAAPRPQLLIAATGDWTRFTMTHEFPAVRSIYRMLGAAGKADAVRFDAPHNYNKGSREAAYAFFGKWLLGDNDAGHFKEKPFTVEPKENLLVWHGREKPANAQTAESLAKMWVANCEKQFADALAAGPAQFRKLYEPALRHALSLEVPAAKDVVAEDCGAGLLALGRPGRGDRVPARLSLPKGGGAKRAATLVVHPKGWLAAEPFAAKLAAAGQFVLAIDCFNHRRKTEDNLFTTYNKTDTQLRVQDIVTALAWLRGRKDVGAINLVGLDEAGLWCLLARPFAPFVAKTVADAAQFDAASDAAWLKSLYVPVLRRAGDFRAALALIGDAPLLVHNAGGKFQCAPKAKQEKVGEEELLAWLGK